MTTNFREWLTRYQSPLLQTRQALAAQGAMAPPAPDVSPAAAGALPTVADARAQVPGALGRVAQPQAPALQQQPRQPALRQEEMPQPEMTEGGGKGYWDYANELSTSERKEITKQFEDAGIDVEAEYNRLVDSGQVDPGMIKRGKDGKLDRHDMGLFLLEFGLRTLQAGSTGMDAAGAIATGALGTIESRRARAAQGTARRDKAAAEAQRSREREEDIKLKERELKQREDIARAELESRERISEAENKTRERIAEKELQRQARARGVEIFLDKDGLPYNVETGEPFLVTDPETGKQKHVAALPKSSGSGALTAKDRAEMRAAFIRDMNKLAGEAVVPSQQPKVKIDGVERRWGDLTPAEKKQAADEYMASVIEIDEDDPLGVL